MPPSYIKYIKYNRTEIILYLYCKHIYFTWITQIALKMMRNENEMKQDGL